MFYFLLSDAQFNVYVKNGWKLHDDKRNKSFLVFSKNAVEKDRWLKAFDEERRKVKSDQENGKILNSLLKKDEFFKNSNIFWD